MPFSLIPKERQFFVLFRENASNLMESLRTLDGMLNSSPSGEGSADGFGEFASKLRDLEHVSSIVVTHQLRDAFYVATHMAERDPDGKVRIVPATPEKEREAEFIMIREGNIVFEGDADALRASTDPYIKEFLD